MCKLANIKSSATDSYSRLAVVMLMFSLDAAMLDNLPLHM